MALSSVLSAQSELDGKRKSFNFPRVNFFEGSVNVQSLDGKLIIIKPGQILKERVRIQTKERSKIDLQLSSQEKIILYESSELLIPNIDEELKQIPLVDLKQGTLQWISEIVKAEKQNASSVSLVSELTQMNLPLDSEIFFEFHPHLAFFEVRVAKGEILFGAFNAEEQQLVKTGQRLKFIGEIENNEIQYDILLKGRKIPRGKLGKIEAFDYQSELKNQKAKEAKFLAEKNKAEALRKQKILEQKTRVGEFICIQPRAKLDQCRWRCENAVGRLQQKCVKESKCVRYRCNAAGEWAERTELATTEICQLGLKKSTALTDYSLIQKCDY